MGRITTGMFNPKGKRLSFLTMMICLEHDCGHMFEASRVSNPCPKCASKAVIPAAYWAPAKYGMPKLELGKVKNESIHKKPV